MSESQNISSATNRFRATVISFACVLGSLAIWILAAEAVRPSNIELAQQNPSDALRRDAALMAARIGLVRGDLWSEAASAYADMSRAQNKSAPETDVAPFKQINAITEQAIARAPHNSRLWLLLAANYFHFDRLNQRVMAALKMSYYTGSNSIEVLPQRLLLAIQSEALGDDEFRDLVRHDIRIAVVRRSELMPALIAAYSNAPPSGKQFIEKALAEFDPSALASVRSEAERR